MTAMGKFPTNTDFLYGSKLTNVTINGGGVMDGQGAAWWTAFNANNAVQRPPAMIEITNCTGVTVTGITVQNSPEFHIQFLGNSANVLASGLTITAAWPSPNTDGIDLRGTNINIQNCYISDGDDLVQIGGSQLCSGVTVQGCTFGTGHGLSIGSITTGGVNNVLVNNCVFNGTQYGLRLKSDRTNGGPVSNITYSNITMSNIMVNPILFYSYYPTVPSSPATDTGSTVTSTTPIWNHVTFENITASEAATSTANTGIIWGVPEAPVSDVLFDACTLTGPKIFEVYNTQGVTFDCNCLINGKAPSNSAAVTTYNIALAGTDDVAFPACGPTPTFTATSAVFTPTHTPTGTPTSTPTATRTSTPVPPTATNTRTNSPTATGTPTSTASVTSTKTASPTATSTATFTASKTATSTSTSVPPSSTPTLTSTVTSTRTSTFTFTPTSTPTSTLVPPTPTVTSTKTTVSTATSTFTSTSVPPTETFTATPTVTLTTTPSSVFTSTATPMATSTSTNTSVPPTNTLTPSPTITQVLPSPTDTPLGLTSTPSFTSTAVSTDTLTPTATSTSSPTDSMTPKPTQTPTVTPTRTATSVPPTLTGTPSFTMTNTPIPPTFTHTPVPTATWTETPVPPSPTKTPLPVFTSTPISTMEPGAPPISEPIPYPNPSSGGTIHIQFVLAAASSDVELRIFTTAFRKVLTLNLGALPAGSQTISVSLTNNQGQALANGIYYLEISDSQGRAIGKLMILR